MHWIDRQTDRPTDRSRESLTTIGRCAPRAMRPNNNGRCTGGLSELSQIRPRGKDKSSVSTHRRRSSRPSERIINRVLFPAGPKDRIGLRIQSGAQLSFSAHFSHCSALQLHLVAQQLSQRRRRVTTPVPVLTFSFNPRDLYYRGYKNTTNNTYNNTNSHQ